MGFQVERPKVRPKSVWKPILKLLTKFKENCGFRNLVVAENMDPI